ncbi:MAG: hypothetical protein LBT41_04590, partial [Candidatus Methanoplasma sp.]|nr:hypothetical protein [Candidatus Methanoplasma sp.]
MPAESEGGASLTVVASPISFSHKPFTVSIDGNDLMETYHGKSMTAAVAQGLHKVKIVNETRESELAADMQGDKPICVSMSERKMFAANSPSEYFRREEELRALHRTAFIRTNGIMGLA